MSAPGSTHSTPTRLVSSSSRRDAILTEIASLNARLRDLERELHTIDTVAAAAEPPSWNGLTTRDVERFGRQMLIPSIGSTGQRRLKQAKVLVVGLGGIGSPVAILLAAGGVGTLGLVDDDVVSLSNLHRQLVHSEYGAIVGESKVDSALYAINRVNGSVSVATYDQRITPANALELFEQYDIIVDCTDNVATRYLLNDASVLANRPLVYGSALRTYGQVAVYHYKAHEATDESVDEWRLYGPCYRCINPRSIAQAAAGNCSDEGVVGPVTSIIGSIQAMEVIKMITKDKGVLDGRMLLVDAALPSFHIMKLRARREDCAVCGRNPTITRSTFASPEAIEEYTKKCLPSVLALLDHSHRVTVATYSDVLSSKEEHLLVDVREPLQFQICHLPNAKNIPMRLLATSFEQLPRDQPIYVVCRRGNQSQRAVHLLRSHGFENARDIIGGMARWAIDVDPSFPVY